MKKLLDILSQKYRESWLLLALLAFIPAGWQSWSEEAFRGSNLWLIPLLLPAPAKYYRHLLAMLLAILFVFPVFLGHRPTWLGLGLLLPVWLLGVLIDGWLVSGKRAQQRLDEIMLVSSGWGGSFDDSAAGRVSREEIAKRRQERAGQLNEVLFSLLQSAASLVNASTVALLWRDAEDKYGMREVFTDSDEFDYDYETRSGDGILGWVIEQKRSWLSSELSGTIDVPLYTRNEGIRSVLVLPILDKGELRGLLYADSRFVQAFAPGHETTLNAFARLVLDHIGFNDIADQHDLEKSRAEAFFQAASSLLEPSGIEELLRKILRTALSIVPVEGAFVALRPQKGGSLSIQMVHGDLLEKCYGLVVQEDSLVDWVTRTLQGVYATNMDSVVRSLIGKGADPAAIRSVLIVPLSGSNEAIGALCLVAREADRFSPHEILIFEKLKQIIAVAIQQRQSYRTAKVMANTDPLTRLPNRRHFFRRFQKEIARLKRSEQPGALMMIDVDFFKKVNDEYGHQTGDEVLQKMASILRISTREHDILGRYGGEEFVVFCPDTGVKAAARLAERIRKKIGQLRFVADKNEFKISASFGIAGFPEHGHDPDRLLQVADATLYKAKETGRDRVEVASREQVENAGTLSGSLG